MHSVRVQGLESYCCGRELNRILNLHILMHMRILRLIGVGSNVLEQFKDNAVFCKEFHKCLIYFVGC